MPLEFHFVVYSNTKHFQFSGNGKSSVFAVKLWFLPVTFPLQLLGIWRRSSSFRFAHTTCRHLRDRHLLPLPLSPLCCQRKKSVCRQHTRIMYSALQREEGEKWEKSVLFEASQVFLNTITDIFRSRHGRFSYIYTSIRYIISMWKIQHNLLHLVLYEVRCLKSNEDKILALAGQFKQLSHEPEKFR